MRRALRHLALRLLALGPALALAAPVAAHAAPAAEGGLAILLPANPLAGGRLFAEKGCLQCHSIRGTGGTNGPDLGRGGMNRPMLEIASVIWNHTPAMQHLFAERHLKRPKFTSEEMANLLSFLYFLDSLDPPGDAVAGARVFRLKACETCHTLRGAGGTAGPSLDGFGAHASPLFLTAAMWNSNRHMEPDLGLGRGTRPSLEAADLPDLLAFLRAQSGGAERVYVRPGNPKRGAELFVQKSCVTCHAVRGQGGNVGPDLGLELRGTLLQIAARMWNHGPPMRKKMAERSISAPQLTAEDMADLLTYAYFFQFVDAPGDPARGEKVFSDRGCVQCHESKPEGKPAAPDLATSKEKLRTSVEIVTAMWNHGGKMEAQMAKEKLVWPVLKEGEMADLVAFLQGLRSGSEAAPIEK